MTILLLAGGTCLYLSFLGWGLSSVLLPSALSSYRPWLGPWLGMMLAAILGVWLSRLTVGAVSAAFAITVVAAGLAVWRIAHETQATSPQPVLSDVFLLASLVTVAMALYPLLYLRQGATTVSLGNCDPGYYVAVARFLGTGSIHHPPLCTIDHPLDCVIDSALLPHVRPGTFLLIGMIADVFHVPAYKIFSILLAVALAVTPPLVGTFVRTVSASKFAAITATVISALSVNQLYFFYQGCAGQIFGQGCLVFAYIFLWKAETDSTHWLSYSAPLAVAICAMLELYQEDVPLFVIPWVVYFAVQLLIGNAPRWQLIRRYAVVGGIVWILDPAGVWYSAIWLWNVRGLIAGWPIQRWGLLPEIIGLRNSYLVGGHRLASMVATIPVACLAIWGVLGWRKTKLSVSVMLSILMILFYEFEVRHFSYGYHKLAAETSFLFIGAFATGVVRVINASCGSIRCRRFVRDGALAALALVCGFAAAPMIEKMKGEEVFVGSDLVQLTEIKKVPGSGTVRLVVDRCWQQLWASYFLAPVGAVLENPGVFFTAGGYPATNVEMMANSPGWSDLPSLVSRWSYATAYFRLPDVAGNKAVLIHMNGSDHSKAGGVLWQNQKYLLLASGMERRWLHVIGQSQDGWITSKGLTIEVPGAWVRLRPTIELKGHTAPSEQLGAEPAVHAVLYARGKSAKRVAATIRCYGRDYTLRVGLNPGDLPTAEDVYINIGFDRSLRRGELNEDDGSRRLVVRMPEAVSLLSRS